MVGVTFGENTVHTYQQSSAPAAAAGGAPASSAFGSAGGGGGLFGQQQQQQPAPAPSFFNQSAPAPSFGTAPAPGFGGVPAPAPNTAFNFAAPAPAPFGAQSPAPLFGAPAPAPAGGTSFFGSSTPAPAGGTSFFGQPAQQQQQRPQEVPYDAAIRAHIDASARNERNRVLQKMTRLFDAYHQGGAVSGEADPSHCFSTVVYNPATAQERQYLASLPFAGPDRMVLAPPAPPQISQRDWRLACVRNPDPAHFVPAALTGADALAVRSLGHQEQAAAHDAKLEQLRNCADALRRRSAAVRRRLGALREAHQRQGRRLLKVMKHVEVARCLHLAQQSAETDAANRLRALRGFVDGDLAPAVAHLVAAASAHQEQAAAARHHRHYPYNRPDGQESDAPAPQQEQQWRTVLQEHRARLTALTATVSADERDLQLIRDRVVAPPDPAGRSQRRLGA